eukprot:g3688.t1
MSGVLSKPRTDPSLHDLRVTSSSFARTLQALIYKYSKNRFVQGIASSFGLSIISILAVLAFLRRISDDSSSWTLRAVVKLVGRSLLSSSRVRNVLGLSALLTLMLRMKAGGNALNGILPSSFASFFLISWIGYYRLNIVEAPCVRYRGTYFNVKIVQNANLTREFWPSPLLVNKNASTALGMVLRDIEYFLFYTRMDLLTETLMSYDKVNTFDLDWYIPEKNTIYDEEYDLRKLETRNSETCVVILIHGLGGTSRETYLKRLARCLHQRGWRVCSFNFWRMDFAEWRNLKIAVDHIHKNNPNAPIAIVGTSLGTHFVLRYLEVVKDDTPVVVAVCLSPVLDLIGQYHATRDRSFTETGIKRVEAQAYKQFIDNTMAKLVRRHLAHEKRKDFDYEDTKRALVEETDADRLYARVIFNSPERKHVYADVEPTKRIYDAGLDNHFSGRSVDKLDSIKVTLLMVCAADDPMTEFSDLLVAAAERNSNIITMVTGRGGHLGWMERIIPTGDCWADSITADFIASALDIQCSTNFILDVIDRIYNKSEVAEKLRNSEGTIVRGGGVLQTTDSLQKKVSEQDGITSTNNHLIMNNDGVTQKPSSVKSWRINRVHRGPSLSEIARVISNSEINTVALSPPNGRKKSPSKKPSFGSMPSHLTF